VLREIDERLRFLENVGVGYLSHGPGGGDAVGR
jgi:excinuclease UvrABC ATPase subunit